MKTKIFFFRLMQSFVILSLVLNVYLIICIIYNAGVLYISGTQISTDIYPILLLFLFIKIWMISMLESTII